MAACECCSGLLNISDHSNPHCQAASAGKDQQFSVFAILLLSTLECCFNSSILTARKRRERSSAQASSPTFNHVSMPSSRLTDLAKVILAFAGEVEEHLRASGNPQPSFDDYSPPELPRSPDVQRKRQPAMRCIVQKNPEVVAIAQYEIPSDRPDHVTFAEHVFFQPQPTSADGYLFRQIFHTGTIRTTSWCCER